MIRAKDDPAAIALELLAVLKNDGGSGPKTPEQRAEYEAQARELFLRICVTLGRDEAVRIFKKATLKQSSSPRTRRGRPRADQFSDKRLWGAFDAAGGSFKKAAEFLAGDNPIAIDAHEKRLQRHIKATRRQHFGRDGIPTLWVRAPTETEKVAFALLCLLSSAKGGDNN
jgi:hypothetical protein